MFHVCPAAPRDIETATDYHEEGEGMRREWEIVPDPLLQDQQSRRKEGHWRQKVSIGLFKNNSCL